MEHPIVQEAFSGKMLSQIHSFHIEKFKKKRLETGAKVRLNRELMTLRAMFNRLGMGKKGLKRYDGPNPFADVDLLTESDGKLRFLSREEADRLAGVCDEPLRTIVLVVALYGIENPVGSSHAQMA